MSNLIERYIYDVIRRLPENEQEEVRKELNSNIYDMLSDDAGEDEIKAVLYQLGSPAELAEKYRQNPRYLISPVIYSDYIRVLKWIIPMVGCICLLVGMILSGIEALNPEFSVDADYFAKNISDILSDGFSMGISGAIQALVWTTIGFAIAERTGYKPGQSSKNWKIEDLPDIFPIGKYKISLSDCIAELIMTVIFSIVGIIWCTGNISFPFIILKNQDIQVTQLFNDWFLSICIPLIIISAIFKISECIIKIKIRRWTPVVCITVIVNNIITAGVTLFIFNHSNIFSSEFVNFLNNFPEIAQFANGNIEKTILLAFTGIVIFACLLECGTAIYRTIRTSALSSSEK